MSAVLEDSGRRRRGILRELLRSLSTVLIVSGFLLVADAAVTVAWQEPVTAFLAQRQQDRLSRDLNRLDRAAPSPLEVRALSVLPTSRRRIAFLARAFKRDTKTGGALGRIKIPKLGASFVVVKGTDSGSLRKGPGLYPQTPLPGVPGTTAIAGHRTTYLAPFRHIDRLKRGDTIELHMPYGDFTYSVQEHRIVDPSDIGVIRGVGYPRLVLSACHPLYSAAKRIVVFARLVRTVSRGAALHTGRS